MTYDIDYLITGGTGLIGAAFIRSLPSEARIVVLSRQGSEKASKVIGRKVEVIADFDQIPDSRSIRFCLNLSGEPIVDKPWTESRKQALRDSRITITSQLSALSKRLKGPFEVMVSGSAIGFYPSVEGVAYDESGPNGDSFPSQLCQEWEAAATAVLAERTCLLRTGIVLSRQGGMLKKLAPSYYMGGGASLGDGQQMMSWVHIDDAVSIIHFLFDNPQASGAVNMCTDKPVSNTVFSDLLAGAMNRPRIINMPTFAVKLLFGQRSALMLDSQTIVPKRLLDLGYSFKYRELKEALSAIYA